MKKLSGNTSTAFCTVILWSQYNLVTSKRLMIGKIISEKKYKLSFVSGYFDICSSTLIYYKDYSLYMSKLKKGGDVIIANEKSERLGK